MPHKPYTVLRRATFLSSPLIPFVNNLDTYARQQLVKNCIKLSSDSYSLLL